MVAPATTKADLTEESAEFGRILPLYPMTEGMTQRIMRQVTAAALEAGAAQVPDVLPREFCRDRELPGVEKALHDVHFPADPKLAAAARRRLAYEELFLFQTALALQRSALDKGGGVSFKIGPNVDGRIRRLFPFTFTPAQDRVIAEVAADMRSEHPMNRLLQGDVGCGKTVVAVYAMLAALAESSKRRQVALMAPTEILAEQHFLTLDSLLERARVRPALLTSGVLGAERERVLGGLAQRRGGHGGRHARPHPGARGVPQPLARRGGRAAPLRRAPAAGPAREGAAAGRPHHDGHARSRARSRWPTSRDMDVSVIDQMPPGRSPVETALYMPSDWDRAFSAARVELDAGRRVFVIYPLVEENRDLDLTSAKEGYEQLSRIFAGYRCCLLHGQMPPAQKQQAMDDFRTGRCPVMAATTVVEVGIDVPEATVMIVQHAERLGLAQLHQLRGRIGRGQLAGQVLPAGGPEHRRGLAPVDGADGDDGRFPHRRGGPAAARAGAALRHAAERDAGVPRLRLQGPGAAEAGARRRGGSRECRPGARAAGARAAAGGRDGAVRGPLQPGGGGLRGAAIPRPGRRGRAPGPSGGIPVRA